MGATLTETGLGRCEITGVDCNPITGYMKVYLRVTNYSIESHPYIHYVSVRESFNDSFSTSILSEMDANSIHTSNGYFVDTYRKKDGTIITGRKVNVKNLSTGDEFTVSEDDLGIEDTVPVNDIDTERWKLLTAIGIAKVKLTGGN